MRYFALLNLQHVLIFLIPTLVFILVFGLGLGFSHYRTQDSARRKRAIHRAFPDGLSERKSPFPVAMALILAGTVFWAFFYIFFTGLYGVRI